MTEPKRYEIEKITDILAIPEDKFDAFVEDLRTYHTMGVHMTKLLETVADIGGIKAQVVPKKMTWIDDDEHNATVYLKTDTKGNDLRLDSPEATTKARNKAQQGSLREQLADVQLDHFVKTHGRNLGQYQTEHDCACGVKLYIDGHDPEKANLHVVQARHIADAQMQLVERYVAEHDRKYDEIFKWLLGENGDFPKSEPGKRYNFRTELRQRLARLRSQGKE